MKMKALLFGLALVMSGPAWAATPGANNLERMEGVVANLLNREITVANDSALLVRIATRFAAHWENELQAMIADPEAEPGDPPAVPTNPQLAGFFLLKMTDFGKDILRAEGIQEERKEAVPTFVDAGNTAAADLE